MIRKTTLSSLYVFMLVFAATAAEEARSDTPNAFVQVCQNDPRYFELTNGEAFIPIGLNICWPRFETGEAQALATLERRLDKLAAGGGNFIRIWMSHPFYNVEYRRSGEYDAKKLRRIKSVLALARERGIRVKLCFEHFRSLEDKPVEFAGSVSFGNPLHHVDKDGPVTTMSEFFQAETSRKQFKRKLRWFAEQIGDDPTVFAWELWNEINAAKGTGWLSWTEEMLAELHDAFPKNMSVQNLGSLDCKQALSYYQKTVEIPANDFAQVHRYLDQGAAWEVCHGPMDILAADAVRQLAAFNLEKPILLAECGAVEPKHAAPSKLYEQDCEGVLLHDLIFAPFFAGAAGSGQSWHWYFYIDKHDLWYHFGRFSEAVQGIDPGREQFSPEMIEIPQLRIYALKGKATTLVWCRDTQSNWQTELVEGKPAEAITGATLSLAELDAENTQTATAYDPWTGERIAMAFDGGTLALPKFTRSIVLRLQHPETQQARTFFVDSEKGADSAEGLSENTAWRSLDRVNAADLKPGDTVRFRCGGVWRGSLRPASGDESAPVTYTSHGKGARPLFLGSAPRNRPEDWVQVEGNVWATLPMEYRQGEELLDLRQGPWSRHQEADASVALTEVDGDGGRVLRFTCDNSGDRPNHVQAWGPGLPLERSTWLILTFRARSTKPFPVPPLTLRQGSKPWGAFATADPVSGEIGSEWRDFEAVFPISTRAELGRLHLSLGKSLPAGAVFEFQPRGLYAATPSVPDPLSVDVGNIIFDAGQVCGWKKWSVDDLKKPYDYYYDKPSRRVYLHATANPATLHKDVEFALKRHIVDQSGAHHATFDGLALKYGAAHGFGGGNTHHLVIRNCNISYIGGGQLSTRPDGTPVRYGNGIEFWGPAHDHLVENCRVWEVYDAALTNQNNAPDVRQENIIYRNNIIWNSEYSFEYWNRPESSITRNIRFVNNTCVDAGVVWSHTQRPDPNGSHLMFYTNSADSAGIVVKHNIFFQVTHWGSRYSAGWKPPPEMDHNLWFSEKGVMAYWFKERIKGFPDYQRITGLDQHSLFADPEFLDPDNGDYRLAPTSPARDIHPNGGPVGANSLWR